MERTDERDRARERLGEALAATDADRKDFHVRQAIQLLRVEE